jgi:hypothetical protein
MVGHVAAFGKACHDIEVIAVNLKKFDAGIDVVKITADHIVAADNLMTIGEKRVRQMAAHKTRNA